jgi:hypothetical protein
LQSFELSYNQVPHGIRPLARPPAPGFQLTDSLTAPAYETVGHFPLPASSWWDDYYAPLERHITEFRGRHRDEPDAQELADQIEREIDIWRAYSAFYHYEFFVMRAR